MLARKPNSNMRIKRNPNPDRRLDSGVRNSNFLAHLENAHHTDLHVIRGKNRGVGGMVRRLKSTLLCGEKPSLLCSKPSLLCSKQFEKANKIRPFEVLDFPIIRLDN